MPKDSAAIEFDTLEYFCRIYQERGRRAMGELAPAIAESMHSEVLEVFETEGYGEWEGFAWQRTGIIGPAKKPSTKGKSGRRWRGTPKLLQDTGNLIGSLTPEWDADIVEVYTNVPYAKYHISPEPRHVIPLRDFFAIDTASFEQDVVDMLDLHLRRHIPSAAE